MPLLSVLPASSLKRSLLHLSLDANIRHVTTRYVPSLRWQQWHNIIVVVIVVDRGTVIVGVHCIPVSGICACAARWSGSPRRLIERVRQFRNQQLGIIVRRNGDVIAIDTTVEAWIAKSCDGYDLGFGILDVLFLVFARYARSDFGPTASERR